MTQDEYLQSQLATILQPGEQVLHTAYMRRQPSIIMQMLLFGGLLLYLVTKAYFVVLTNRRLILIRTKMGFWSGGAQLLNLGVEFFDARALQKCTTSGFAANRSMTFNLADGTSQTLRIYPNYKKIAGTRAFFDQVPNLISSGQLAQLAGGAAMGQLPMGGQPQMQQPMQPQMQAQPQMQQPMQQPQMQAQPQMQQPMQQQPQGFAPGSRVTVTYPDGNRYPATVVQAAPD